MELRPGLRRDDRGAGEGEQRPIEPAARLLEVFLDRLAWKAATTRAGSEAFLLDPRYDAMQRPEAETQLRKRLEALLGEVTPEERGTPAWRSVQGALAALGAPGDRLSRDGAAGRFGTQ